MYDSSRQALKSGATLLVLLLAAIGFNGCSGPEAEAQGQTVEERLAVLEADLAERERELAERSAMLAEREQMLASTYEELAGRLENTAERERELEGRIDGLSARASGLNERRAELEEREAELERRARSVAGSEVELASQRRTVDEARARAERAAEAARRDPPEVYAEVSLAPATRLEVEFLSTVSSASSRPGDRFTTRVTEDVYASDGRLVVPAGSELMGTVTEAVPLKRVGGQARLGLDFGELHLPWGKSARIQASFAELGRNEKRRDRRIIGGAAAGGAILGAILDDGDAEGTLLGAIVGAAAGTAAAANKRRDEVEIPGGAVVSLRLDEPVLVQVPWKSRYSEGELAEAGR